MVLDRVPIDPLADEPFVVALRSADATTRGDAIRRSDLPHVSEDMLAALVSAGIVGRVDDERYFVIVRPEARNARATFTPRSVALMTGFWVFALLMPLVVWLIAR